MFYVTCVDIFILDLFEKMFKFGFNIDDSSKNTDANTEGIRFSVIYSSIQ